MKADTVAAIEKVLQLAGVCTPENVAACTAEMEREIMLKNITEEEMASFLSKLTK